MSRGSGAELDRGGQARTRLEGEAHRDVPPACELLVRIDWVDEMPDGTVQDADRTRHAIAFAGWIELARGDPPDPAADEATYARAGLVP